MIGLGSANIPEVVRASDHYSRRALRWVRWQMDHIAERRTKFSQSSSEIESAKVIDTCRMNHHAKLRI
jgi:hypothetical protein